MSLKKQEHKRLWTHIDAKNQGCVSEMRWTDSAEQCLELNANCSQCPISKTVGINRFQYGDRKCWMQVAVQRLLDREVPMRTKSIRINS